MFRVWRISCVLFLLATAQPLDDSSMIEVLLGGPPGIKDTTGNTTTNKPTIISFSFLEVFSLLLLLP